jgi:galactokinase
MGKMNTAKLIDFVPSLKATDVKVPDSVSLVIANSLTPSPKLLTLGTRYNKRVVECRFGVALLALHKKLISDYMSCHYTTFQ